MIRMERIGWFILAAGVLLAVAGGAVVLLSKVGFRGLPGDIVIEGRHGSFYFPIVTCLVLSAILTLVMWLWRWMR